MENVNHSGWSVKTLQRLAEALDVALVVKFETFGAVLSEAEISSPESLAKPSFASDPFFAQHGETETTNLALVEAAAHAHIARPPEEYLRTMTKQNLLILFDELPKLVEEPPQWLRAESSEMGYLNA
jgi:hypothetical protein